MYKAGFGLIALAAVAFTTPALAQSIHLGGGSSEVRIGVGDRHHSRDYDRRRHHSYGVRTYDDSYASARCKTTRIIRSDGSVKTIRRCR